MVQYKLYYFNIRGLAESIRMALTYGGIKFEDVRFDQNEWQDLKPKMPFGKIPVLEVDGVKMPESLAILRYISRKAGIAGSTPEEQALVDALADLLKDVQAEIREFILRKLGRTPSTPEEVEKCKTEKLIPARDKYLPMFVSHIKKSGSGYLVGKNLTFADILLAEHVFTMNGLVPGYADKYPEISALQKKVYAHPKLAKWIESRPESQI